MVSQFTMNLNGPELLFKWPVTELESEIIQIACQRWLPDFPQTFEFHDFREITEFNDRFRTLMESTKVCEAQYIQGEQLANVLDYCCHRAKIDKKKFRSPPNRVTEIG